MDETQKAKNKFNYKKTLNTELTKFKNSKSMIIITGELAAGKTSYGKKISKLLEIPFFSKKIRCASSGFL